MVTGKTTRRGIIAALAACILLAAAPPLRSAPSDASVYMEELTWVELRDAIAHGKTVAIGCRARAPRMS